ncbi:hypothetical protein [Streptomyces sp. I05A-00742]|uniref:hypothetical protein n=1 Tax=Streptomyces sp. I05A-00742 TaxID=2732853 RepID=UPI001489745B|nr:hypothetical protein [Streptomyces sp. I05A-00742]
MTHTNSLDVGQGYLDATELDLDVRITESDVTADFDRKALTTTGWSGGVGYARCGGC